MAQGKLKVKTKLPAKTKNNKNKGTANKSRSNKPIQPKKQKLKESQKIKKIISKSVNAAVEQEMRNRAGDGKKNLSRAEQAVAAHNVAQASKSR